MDFKKKKRGLSSLNQTPTSIVGKKESMIHTDEGGGAKKTHRRREKGERKIRPNHGRKRFA